MKKCRECGKITIGGAALCGSCFQFQMQNKHLDKTNEKEIDKLIRKGKKVLPHEVPDCIRFKR